MRIHRATAYIAIIFTIFAFALAILNYYVFESGFWSNISIGIFGSGVLTTASSLAGYFVERRKNFERFYDATLSILRQLYNYPYHADYIRKCEFLLNYDDVSKELWNSLYYGFCFFFDRGKTEYIYKSICAPICELDKRIADSKRTLKCYYDKNDRETINGESELKNAIDNIEEVLYTYKKGKYRFHMVPLADSIRKELNGKYFNMMYHNNRKKENL